jgi:pyruvate-ferredoxin/flavodoxin oxidoreductase
VNLSVVKDIQLLQPLFEFSGACSGCGETPYISLMTRLFGDRMVIANATGCSSIYGGNLPTTPYTTNSAGRGPAWSNSLFEDNAEFGMGIRLAADKQSGYAHELVTRLANEIGGNLADEILRADQSTEKGINDQRERGDCLRQVLRGTDSRETRDLMALADALVKKSVWILGGDGWAYDIGYGGLDHVLASSQNVNILVLDTEVYSNTGGQGLEIDAARSRSQVRRGRQEVRVRRILRLMAVNYGSVYVARVAMGGNDQHTLKAFIEAESWNGPSLILAYSHCIAQRYDLVHGIEQQKNAVLSGYWPLFRYDPRRVAEGKNPFQLDSRPATLPLDQYIYKRRATTCWCTAIRTLRRSC